MDLRKRALLQRFEFLLCWQCQLLVHEIRLLSSGWIHRLRRYDVCHFRGWILSIHILAVDQSSEEPEIEYVAGRRIDLGIATCRTV